MSSWMSAQLRMTTLAWLATWLTAFSLSPLFEIKRFLVVSFVSSLVVALVGAGLRALRSPRWLVLLGQVVALLEWSVVAYATPQAPLGFVPSPHALGALADLVSQGVDTANKYAAPVPPDTGLVLMAAVGVGAIAILVDLLAVGLRHVPMAGLPLLALYTVPVAAAPHGVPALLFIPGAAAFIALIGAAERERLSHWGKQIARGGQLWNANERDKVHTGALALAGRRIGFAAVALAVFLPLVLPTFPERLFGAGSGPGDGNGPLEISNPILDLKRDLVQNSDVDEIRVLTNDPDPGYLRFTSLDEFDGTSWRPSVRDIPPSQRAISGLPPPPGLSSGVRTEPVHYDLTVSTSFSSGWLPAPYPTREVNVSGDWRYNVENFDILSATSGQTTAGLHYQLDALLVDPTTEQLLAAGPPPAQLAEHFTALPNNLPAAVVQTAAAVSGDAATDFQRAVEIQNWFRSGGGFKYSTATAAGSSTETLVNFLTTDRVGYCEQFASAMALMARSLDIPARVAVGFRRPEHVGPDTYVYSSHDLHAWPELYFGGVGWVRFEPTPPVLTGAAPSYTQGVENAILPPSVTPTPTANATASDPVGRLQPRDPGGSNTVSVSQAGNSQAWPILLLGLLLLLVLSLPTLARSLLRRWRWRPEQTPAQLAEAAWDELRDSACDYGLPWEPTLSPRGTGRSLLTSLRDDPRARAAMDSLVTFVERARYARTVEADPQARARVETIVAVMRSQASRGRRIRARVLASSLLPDLTWAGRSVRAWMLRGRQPAEVELAAGDPGAPA
jgi:transglutaminase-like putative cysteine protease